MQRRRRFKQTMPLGERLSEEAARLRRQARSVQNGFERDRLLRRARQAETAAKVNEWLSSPSLQPPA
jgi:hypothetical protein